MDGWLNARLIMDGGKVSSGRHALKIESNVGTVAGALRADFWPDDPVCECAHYRPAVVTVS